MAVNKNANSVVFLLTLAILHESGLSPKKDANKARLQITICHPGEILQETRAVAASYLLPSPLFVFTSWLYG